METINVLEREKGIVTITVGRVKKKLTSEGTSSNGYWSKVFLNLETQNVHNNGKAWICVNSFDGLLDNVAEGDIVRIVGYIGSYKDAKTGQFTLQIQKVIHCDILPEQEETNVMEQIDEVPF